MLFHAGRAATLFVLAGLQALWLCHPDLPWGLRLVQVAFVVVACWRPGLGLIIMSALAPVAGTLTALAGSPLTGARHIEVMVLAVVAGVVIHRRAGDTTRTGRAALIFGAIALASAASIYPTRLLHMPPDPHYFVRSAFWDPVFFGMLAAEGAALVWAVESLGRRHPRLLVHVVIATLLGHASATLLTLRELLDAASRNADAFTAFVDLFVNVRTHSEYDVNAAASALVLIALASVGVMNRMRALLLTPAVLLVLAGLWQTGSRVALVALVAAAVVALGCSLVQLTRRQLWLSVAAIVALLAVSAGVFYLYPGRRNINLNASINSRRVMMETGLRMAQDAPATGIGVGRFHELSADYGSSEISRILGVNRTRDNAHNNFIQVLAELGIVGLLAFLWLLWSAFWGALRGWRARALPDQWFVLWLTAGIGATMVTWLTGHPLLVPRSALVFWTCAGLAAASGDARSVGTAMKWWGAVLLVLVAASIPWQSAGQRDRAHLEHLGRGLTVWQPEVDGQRYRVGDNQSAVFVPTGASIVLPVRLAPASASPLEVDVLVEGERVNRIAITPHAWTDLQLDIRPARRRFVEVRIEAPAGVSLWIGRAESKPLQ